MDNKNQDSYLLSSVYNSLQILDLLGRKTELTMAEISKETGFGRSSTFRMLYTLEKCKYVHKTSDGKYRLGFKFASFGTMVANYQDLADICRPYMRALRSEFDEAVQLGILTDSGKAMFIAKEASTKGIQMNTAVWKETEAYSMSSGKILLAYLDKDKQRRFAEGYTYYAFTENTIKNAEELLVHLETVRNRGFSQDLEESEVGLVCFAAPILGGDGKCMFSLSVSGPAGRMYPRRDSLIRAVVKTAKEISAALGYAAE